MEVFSGTNHTGYSVKLPVGKFSKGELALDGITANDIESIKILKEGASARIYTSTKNTGASLLCKTDRKTLSTTYKNLINSITVAYEDPVGISKPEEQKENGQVTVYTLDGQLLGIGKDAIHHAKKGQTVLMKTGEKSVKIKVN